MYFIRHIINQCPQQKSVNRKIKIYFNIYYYFTYIVLYTISGERVILQCNKNSYPLIYRGEN
jgi:hypothetical protein